MNSAPEQVSDSRYQLDADSLVAHYEEIEQALSRVEHALTHYEVLGLKTDAAHDQIKSVYEQAVALFQQSQDRATIIFPDQTLARFDRAKDRIKHAFNVLSDDSKRTIYNLYLSPDQNKPTVSDHQQNSSDSITLPQLQDYSGLAPSSAWPQFDLNNPFEPEPERYIEFTHSASEENRRRFERFKLSMPVYVTGHDKTKGEWHEMTHTIDVSRIGTLLYLRRRVRHRTLLHLALPLPMKLRCHRHSEPSYSVYALVRRVEPPRDGFRVAAVEFVGEHPPAGYIEKPWATYATKWNGIERRRAARRERSEVVCLDYLGENNELICQEAATLENISSSGMRISVKSPPSGYDLIKVSLPSQGFESLATVCNRFVGKDRLERLCVQFIHP